MRPYYSLAGLMMLMFGALVLCVRSIASFTHEQMVGPLGVFSWDDVHPHTLLVSPLAGIVAMAVGIAMIAVAHRQHTI